LPGLLTAALIVRDESAVLADCLRSIRDVVDEIVVVDTGSVDDTMAIARAEGARVVEQAWTDDFSAARNRALDEAEGQWILYIDADERLAPVDRTTVETMLRDAEEVAFRILFRPIVDSTLYREFRVWRSDPRIRFENIIHENVVPAIQRVASSDGRPISTSDALLLEHIGYEGDQTRKHRRNLPLLQRQLEVTPDNLFMWHHLARVQFGLDDDDAAERTLERAVEIARAKDHLDDVAVLSYADLVSVRLARKEPVRELLAEARDLFPDNWVLASLEGRVLIDEGRYEDAVAAFEQIADVDITPDLADKGPSYDVRVFGETAQDQRAVALFRLGRFAEAADAWGEAARLAPDDETYGPKRRVALARAGRRPT
jgi:glycosyltransferase involved in cell wall biosynthesis